MRDRQVRSRENEVALEVRDLSVQFGPRPLFDPLSFSLAAGQRLLIGGESGVGKSTLLNCLVGFVLPVAGQIRVQGRPLTSHSVWSIRRQMAYVPQQPDLGRGTVQEALAAPFRFAANQRAEPPSEHTESLLERFRLGTDLLTLNVSRLSGGQKQRLAIIAAILLARPITLLDEPTSALDAPSRQAVVEFFRARDTTLLWISHETRPLWEPDQVVTLSRPEGTS